MLCAHILKPRKNKFPLDASEGRRNQKDVFCISSTLRPTKIYKMPASKMYYKNIQTLKNCLNQEALK